MSLFEPVFLCISCANHSNHGPFVVSRNVVLHNSRMLGQQLMDSKPHATPEDNPTDSLLVLKSVDGSYDCRILESIISTWRQSIHVPVGQPDLEPFGELQQLARALWDYGCSPRWFEPFANGVRDIRWKDHYRTGFHSQAWAFIAVVFGWRDVFGRAVMDISELADAPQPQHPPNLWPEQFERSVLRNIVSPECYRRQRKVAYDFIRNACCRLEGSEASHKAIFERLRACFAGRGFKVLLPEEDNAEPLRAVGAGRLLRLFETFLQEPIHNAAAAPGRWEPPPPPRGRRFQHQPLLWRTVARRFSTGAEAAEAPGEDNEGPVTEAQLGELRKFRDTQFMPLLFVDIGNRFQQVRARGLISTEEALAVELPVMWDQSEG